MCGLLVYAVVTYVGHSMVEVRDRLAAVVIRSAAFIVMGTVLLLLGYTFWRAGRRWGI